MKNKLFVLNKCTQSQRFLVTISGVSAYTTASQIRRGFGGTASINHAVAEALLELETIRAGTVAGEASTRGVVGTWNNLDVQLSMVNALGHPAPGAGLDPGAS
jgi:hypothetical protein